MNKALELAAQCWCLKETEHLIMIPELAEAFAYTLDPILGELDEIRQENQRLREALLDAADDISVLGDYAGEAQIYAKTQNRSVPKQIQHWADIGKMAEENPDLPYEFIRDLMIAMAEAEAGKFIPYVREED